MDKCPNTKYVFVTGGVISGLGKGTATSSIALLLKSAGYNVSALKADMYLNIDAGTMNPVEHGEVFVTDDGMETDQDIGNYERFLNRDLSKHNYMTMGQIYYDLITRERAFEFEGKTVQGHVHVPEEIINRLELAANKDRADIMMVEVGGTVGEYQNILFFEAVRRLKQKCPNNVYIIHLVYLLTPNHIGEMKSKPAQASIYDLYKLGLSPDIVLCRSGESIDEKRKNTLSFNTGVPQHHIFAAPNISSIYKIPQVYAAQGLDDTLLDIMKLERKSNDLIKWDAQVKKMEESTKKVKIGILGKYFASGSFSLADAYLCVIEALKHAGAELGVIPEIEAINVEEYTDEELSQLDGVIVPQGWGSRGVEDKVRAIKYVRENKVPFLGLCFGMQMAVIEYARDILGLSEANTLEANPDTPDPVIYIMPDQEKYLKEKNYGGTIRLGAWPCKLSENSTILESYKKYAPNMLEENIVNERHRHRYEVNNDYKEKLQAAGLIISGTSPDDKLAEAIELPKDKHPFFVATQFHPEYKSRPLRPHPLFCSFLEACTSK
ncbi:MAG: CTP synthase [Patescibacteria group bacterium]